MLSKYIMEQPVACKILNNSIDRQNISHAYLFISNQYSKTMDLVIDFAKEIITKNIENESLKQDIINKIENGIYNDLKIIDTDGLWIKKEVVEDLQEEFSNKSVNDNKRIYIINNAHKLNMSSSNAILKFLEEPEKDIIAILVTDNKYQLIDTIISRCVNINLIKDNLSLKFEEKKTKEKIASIIFNNDKEREEFLINPQSDSLIQDVINFVKFYEENKNQTILQTNKIWHEKIKEKIEIQIAFDLMIFFYNDILNVALDRKINIFNDYCYEINCLCNKNTIEQICNKINILIEMKEKIKYNVNSKLLMDKLVIKLGGEDCD